MISYEQNYLNEVTDLQYGVQYNYSILSLRLTFVKAVIIIMLKPVITNMAKPKISLTIITCGGNENRISPVPGLDKISQ